MKKSLYIFPLFLLSSLLSCSTISLSVGKDIYKKIEENNEEQNVEKKLIVKHLYFESSGDATLLKVGNKNILIDSGPSDSDRFIDKLGLKPNEDKLDYVIFTHKDGDHIGNFTSVFQFEIDTLIDFDSTVDMTVPSDYRNAFESVYSDTTREYQRVRDLNIESKKINNYVTASQCCFSDRGIKRDEIYKSIKAVNRENNTKFVSSVINSGHKFGFKVGDLDFSIDILYNKFNDVPCGTENSFIANNMSVCSLLTYCGEKYLFTGDLMEFGVSENQETTDNKNSYSSNMKPRERIYGETNLITYPRNHTALKGGVLYYRGGHHGSDSSNSQKFASVIRPQYIFWSGGGQSQYNFPRPLALLNMGKYTDRIYYSAILKKYLYPNQLDGDRIIKLYGETTFTYSPESSTKKIKVDYETVTDKYIDDNGLEKIVIRKEPSSIFFSSLFSSLTYSQGRKKESREYPFYIYNLTDSKVAPNNPMDCSYIKLGHIDILIGGGSLYKKSVSKEVINKIKYLCNDKVIDYAIIPSPHQFSYSYFSAKNGLFSQEDIVIDNIIYQDIVPSNFTSYTNNFLSNIKANQEMPFSSLLSKSIVLPLCDDEEINKAHNLKLTFLDAEYTNKSCGASSPNEYSIHTLFTVEDFAYLHLGANNTYGYSSPEDYRHSSNYLLDNNEEIKEAVNVLQAPYFGHLETNKSGDMFYDFVSKITNKKNNTNYSYGDNNSSRSEGLDGLVAMMNTTLYQSQEGDVPIMKYPSDIVYSKTFQQGTFKYKKSNGTLYNLLAFSTFKTINQSKTEPYVTELANKKIVNSDIAMRVTVQKYGEIDSNDSLKAYYKITYGIERNYSSNSNELYFVSNDTGSSAEENVFGKIRTNLSPSDFPKPQKENS